MHPQQMIFKKKETEKDKVPKAYVQVNHSTLAQTARCTQPNSMYHNLGMNKSKVFLAKLQAPIQL